MPATSNSAMAKFADDTGVMAEERLLKSQPENYNQL
jgi:hypothetical protein